MDEMLSDLMYFLKNPSFTETFIDIILCAVPIWLAVMIGLLIGWSWRPRWTGLIYLGFRSKLRFLWTAAPPGFGARRLWLAFTALSAFSVCRTVWSSRANKSTNGGSASHVEESLQSDDVSRPTSDDNTTVREQETVTENDLEHLLQLLEVGNATREWQSMMDKTTPNMSYQAWRHEPETGPVIYRSRTIFEDASPDIVRDFFWDDEFRPKWDFMLATFKTLEEDTQTGTMIVHWRKKFPFFCSDREYIIGRRIWESGNKYYCVTKGVPYPALPKRDKPRRVELYFSSWVIRAVESRKGDGQPSACEVSLVHYEDMGIPKDVAKLGVRHGMWGAVKKLNSGLRAYQAARKSDSSLSRIAQMARITTVLNMDSTESSTGHEERSRAMGYARGQRDHLRMDWKWVVIGGVALACGLHTGVIGKALLAGAGQRLARR
ncbi:Polyketide cyclase/dehydrase and lipid transport superfamily protein [Hirschfeldia incana]|nr:Polyketide cyclase/dehydrase and lipid transport superfamily protein [Hirschfeldia incana]